MKKEMKNRPYLSGCDRMDKANAVSTEQLEIKIAENFEEFLGANVDSEDLEKVSDTGELISSYVDAAQTDLNKDVIKNKLRELFVEAQNTEIV